MDNKKLTKEELSQLLGGLVGGNGNSLCEDVENRNHGNKCKCTYNNTSNTTNVNVGEDCCCTCI